MKLSLTVFCLFITTGCFAQLNAGGLSNNMFIVSLGVDKPFINNKAFNNWSQLNYNNHQNCTVGGTFNLDAITRHYNFGMSAAIGNPYALASIYAGRRLTAPKSAISSFLNLQLGLFAFHGANGDGPLNYTPTADEADKKLYLQYSAIYIGLSSRNYINKFHFSTGKGKNKISFNSGFFCSVNIEPWESDWRYGYNKASGRYSHFISNRVYDIPKPNQLFFETGIFIGLGN